MPSELTSIGTYAFSGIQLTAINLPSKLQTIGDYAFQNNTSVTTLTIPGNVKTIGVSAFSGATNVTSLTINYGVQTICSSAFTDMKITSLVVPNSVTSIGSGAFQGCNSLTEITLPFVGNSRTATYYNAVFGYIFGYVKTYGSSWYYNWSNDFVNESYNVSGTTWQYSCVGSTKYNNSSNPYHLDYYNYYIPTSIKSVTITDATKVSTAAFNGCNKITSITINSGAQGNIYANAFYNCNAEVTYN